MTTAATRPSIDVFGSTFQNPILLAAGTAGFGRELLGMIDIDALGGIVTKAVSPEPRAGNVPPRVAEFAGGMLNAVGLANPGLDRVEGEYLPWLAEHVSRARVIVNVVGNTVADYVQVVERLGGHGVVSAFELNVSCPNTEQGGQEFGADDATLTQLLGQVRRVSTKPLIVKLAPNLPALTTTARAVADAGADGFTMVNTLPSHEHDPASARAGNRLGFGRGGVSGPVLKPIGVRATATVRAATDLPVIGAGGVATMQDVWDYLDAGASLVAVGTAALADPRVPERLAAAWSARA